MAGLVLQDHNLPNHSQSISLGYPGLYTRRPDQPWEQRDRPICRQDPVVEVMRRRIVCLFVYIPPPRLLMSRAGSHIADFQDAIATCLDMKRRKDHIKASGLGQTSISDRSINLDFISVKERRSNQTIT